MSSSSVVTLGEGGSGVVERVRLENGTILARKCFKANGEKYCQHEISIFQKLNQPGHSNVVRMFSSGSTTIDMELVEGATLFEVSHRQHLPNITPQQFETMMMQGLSAIDYIHGKGLIHFDIKPTNLLISNAGELKICDFGLTGPYNGTSFLRGTYEYMPPELWMDQPTNFTVDIWSFGVTMFEVLAMHHPFLSVDEMKLATTMRYKLVKERIANHPSLHPRLLGVKPYFLDLVNQMMTVNVSMRPTAKECLQFLERKQVESIGTISLNSITESPAFSSSSTGTSSLSGCFLKPLDNWRNLNWKISSEDEATVFTKAKQLNMEPLAQPAIKLAQYLRIVYLKQTEEIHPLAQSYLEKMEEAAGCFGDPRVLQILIIACMAITKSKQFACQFIATYVYKGNFLRSKKTLDENFKKNARSRSNPIALLVKQITI